MPVSITADTKLNTVLDAHPDVVTYIVGLNPHDFARLTNAVMRRVMAPRITLGRVAAMAHVPVEELLAHIAAITHATVLPRTPAAPLPFSATVAPAWVTQAAASPIHIVDLLPMDAALNADPLPPVMRAITRLAPGDVLLIKHAWEPQPFYDLWTRIGNLDWFSQAQHAEEWWIWVRRTPQLLPAHDVPVPEHQHTAHGNG